MAHLAPLLGLLFLAASPSPKTAPSPGPTTWVFPASRRNAAECSTLARSLANAPRCSLTCPPSADRFGRSGSIRAWSCSVYG